MPVDEEKALHAGPQSSPLNSPLDENPRKSLTSNIPLSSATMLPHIQPSTRASVRQQSQTDIATSSSVKNKQPKPPPKLLHPILNNVPIHIRFGLNGFLTNVLFMIAYNFAVVRFEHMASSSTIYAAVYLIFIPVTHACISLLVFGWPERYLRSLMSNAPVGLTAIVLGAALTAYLDEIEFNRWVADAVVEYWKLLGYKIESLPPMDQGPVDQGNGSNGNNNSGGGKSGEFYSSIFVLIVTGIWTFVLSVFVNAPQESLEKKEL
ncbi:hypothetical protein IV203_025885 [Nitzschia inconspicua]|uniref:Uncharacterized protein n=1 Tax=Nitzschia inconspicua TaxID=303405 RepID=A0A9K3PYW7_9STRA|nr:hypothetical protein IV203_025885 [Nitzschia inconspicua]